MELTKKVAVPAAVILVLALAIPVLAAIHYFQGFESDTSDWVGVNRVASGTHDITSAAGGYHAEAATGVGDYTLFGGYEKTFPAGGYTTSIDVYLNVGGDYANDTRFDWSSAIGDPNGGFRRDFVFNVGFYNDSDATGTGPRFVISASNNGDRSGAYPKNPGRDPVAITTSGWYTFQHQFSSENGVLTVNLIITKLDGTPVHTWTLSDPTDVIGTTVGGHRYGWLVIQEFPTLAIDNVSLLSVINAATVSACKNGGWQGVTRNDGSTFVNQGDCIQYVNTGK